jgi:hypothetical protein
MERITQKGLVMAEHYTRNTTGVLKFCNRCGKMTLHKVSGKKIGLCTEDHHVNHIKKEYVEDEPKLF